MGISARAILLAAAALCVASPGWAHKLKESQSEVRFRPDTRTIEVTHQLHLDDAVFLLRALQAGSGAHALGPEEQAQLLLYVEHHFELQLNGRPIELEPVGAQFDGDLLWIYQEASNVAAPERVGAEITLLHDLFVDATNRINWIVGDEVESLELDRDRPAGEFGAESAP